MVGTAEPDAGGEEAELDADAGGGAATGAPAPVGACCPSVVFAATRLEACTLLISAAR